MKKNCNGYLSSKCRGHGNRFRVNIGSMFLYFDVNVLDEKTGKVGTLVRVKHNFG